MELESQRNNEERQEKEKVIKELKRVTIQEMARDFLYKRSNCF